jgi:AraC-like DNA-binding protein
METLGILFQAFSAFLALMAASILLWINKEHSHSKKLLIYVLSILALLNLNGVIFHKGWYLQVPWLHKIAIPFTLLIAPVSWLYTRSLLRSELKARKTDWFVLVPAILFALNLIPYYLMPMEEKRAYLAEYYQKSSLRTSEGEGLLPAYIFPYIRGIWSAIFIILNDRLIRNFRKSKPEKVVKDNKDLLNWLTLLNGLLTLLIATAIFVAIIAPFKKTGFNLLDISLGAIVFVICIQLFIRPRILYGLFQPSISIPGSVDFPLKEYQPIYENSDLPAAAPSISTEDNAITITQSSSLRYKSKLERFFIEQQPFLKTDYSLDQLVSDIQIPRYILSTFINREYGMGFREYINRYRVNYLLQNIDRPNWKNLTLEAIAEECGFKSRITFIKNFKQITGSTPSDYFKANSIKVNTVDL